MPVMEIFRTAYGFVLGNMAQFFGIAWPAVLGLAAMFILEDFTSYSASVRMIPQAMIEALFALLWHRYFLLGREYAGFSGLPKGSSKEQKEAYGKISQRFMWRSVGLVAAMIAFLLLVVAPITFFASATYQLESEAFLLVWMVISAGFLVVLGPTVVRILPLFPALATGDLTAKMSNAWRLTKGHGTNIWLCLMMVFLPLILVNVIASVIAGFVYELQALPELARSVLANALMATVSLFNLAVGVTVNSEIYRRLTGFDAAAMRASSRHSPT